jgi:ABC-type spermidine/putrescine transport system permease subunit II
MNAGSPWPAIMSLVLGTLCALALFDESKWGRDSWVGFFALAIPGLVTGIAAVKMATSARGVAIAGIVLSSIALLAGIADLAG